MSLVVSRRALLAPALALPLLVGCGAAPGYEEPGPEVPRGAAVGTDDPAPAEQAPAGYAENAAPAEASGNAQGETVVIGRDDPADDFNGPNPAPTDDYTDADPSALTDFHSALDPYGTWADDPSYGTIWQPNPNLVGPDFAPYETAGHWTYGDDYVWVSDYSWGWAPFHYGRWVYATNGWGWIPGRQYAGAWTTWRTGYGEYAGYVGWAPLPPTYYWRNGVAMGIGIVPQAAFGFVRNGDLFAPSLGGRFVSGPGVNAIGAHSAPLHGAVTAMQGHPSLNGGLSGRTVAHPEVQGPAPGSLRVSGNWLSARGGIPRPPTNNAGLNHARQFAHPSTAVALGAHPPANWSGNTRVASAARPYGSSLGTSAYGASRSFGTETRTIGSGGGAWDRAYVGGHAVGSFHGGSAFAREGGFHGGNAYSYGGFHGGGVHGGLAPAPQAHSPYYGYGGGTHSVGGGGGHFGGHGGGGHGGGHR